jgi:hypothetical protein
MPLDVAGLIAEPGNITFGVMAKPDEIRRRHVCCYPGNMPAPPPLEAWASTPQEQAPVSHAS